MTPEQKAKLRDLISTCVAETYADGRADVAWSRPSADAAKALEDFIESL